MIRVLLCTNTIEKKTVGLHEGTASLHFPAPLGGNFAFLTSDSERARGQVTVALAPWLSALLSLLEPF